MWPTAKWVTQAAAQLKQVDEIVTQMHGGPLGLVPKATLERRARPASARAEARGSVGGGSSDREASPRLDETVAVPGKLLGDSLLPERLLILVAGSGSYLLIRNARASIVRAATADPAGLPVVANLPERTAGIGRVEAE